MLYVSVKLSMVLCSHNIIRALYIKDMQLIIHTHE